MRSGTPKKTLPCAFVMGLKRGRIRLHAIVPMRNLWEPGRASQNFQMGTKIPNGHEWAQRPVLGMFHNRVIFMILHNGYGTGFYNRHAGIEPWLGSVDSRRPVPCRSSYNSSKKFVFYIKIWMNCYIKTAFLKKKMANVVQISKVLSIKINAYFELANLNDWSRC